jgi:hypothetical protein
MTSNNMQCILYTCYCVLAVLEWHQERMSSFWVSKGAAASSSAVYHLRGAPGLKGVRYVSVIVHYKHDESSTAGVRGC